MGRDLAWQGHGAVAKPAIPPIGGKFYPIPFLFQLEHPSKAGGMSWGMAHARGRSWDVWGSLSKAGRGIEVSHNGQAQGTLQQP